MASVKMTEMMDEINIYFSKFDAEKIKSGRRGRDEFVSHKNNYLWAKEYVYGIEKDYRLAKTTKISSFLNGDYINSFKESEKSGVYIQKVFEELKKDPSSGTEDRDRRIRDQENHLFP